MDYTELQNRAERKMRSLGESRIPLIHIGTGTCGLAAGAGEVLAEARAFLNKSGLLARIVEVGCLGLCYQEPLLGIKSLGHPMIYYGRVSAANTAEILKAQLIDGEPDTKAALFTMGSDAVNGVPDFHELPFVRPQVRIALRNCGLIDPGEIDHYLARGGYEGLKRALGLSPHEVIEEIKASGLRGRGGAGFPTGVKWDFAHKSKSSEKYFICNADEGDPGAFMDRSLLEGDPHAVLEGMIIGAYAIGASEGYVYIRTEYPLAIKRLETALEQMKAYGLLGGGILDKGFAFHIKIKEGAGAFVCGEETALMASIAGGRGMPRSRPPFPAQAGLWERPTNINNVETLANVSAIMERGADWFAGYGTKKSKGTKTFSLAGKIRRTGLIEVPMGTRLKEIIEEIGGGVIGGGNFKAVQTGGPSGGCIPFSLNHLPVDYESLAEAGSIMGSGGMVVMDERTCMVDMARYFLTFTGNESCGKCLPCRLGSRQLLDILIDICEGRGSPEDLDLLEEVGEAMQKASLCGLGQTAPNPVISTLKYFRQEYEKHVIDHKCPAGVCKALFFYQIDPEKCTGCMACLRKCPANAISGSKKEPHEIDQEACIRCGECYDSCKFEAVAIM
ncbi:NADH-quinone oxidoreductase subunit NuoF [Dethiosulfatarculus sandiegensis]|uniref:NADP oxidoreductase n=1 Tax=Dethiosulfatarculus sandiegensis TaxID=1429043 RepID=A0A0D2IXP2_9BACT|nr:NADH-quinone oxidoreductase subunit NuoF [Dethiosulfatarculus sandiegensis]KIX10824.1 NADP oxidoreductase [Dethiosulfatarculus sandiegensis]